MIFILHTCSSMSEHSDILQLSTKKKVVQSHINVQGMLSHSQYSGYCQDRYSGKALVLFAHEPFSDEKV